MQQHRERLKQTMQLDRIPESKKFERIYRQGPSLAPEDVEATVAQLRADCRYARLVVALIDASKNEKLAIEELFSKNAVSPGIVTSCKWLYTSENKGFVSEDFVRKTLPLVSSSCQKRIVNKISKWVTNTDLGDKLWNIVRSRSVELSSMLVGACSNELIMREIVENNLRLSLAQMLDILRKRFDSGVDLVLKMAEAKELSSSPIYKDELFRFILKRNLMKGLELISSVAREVRLGRHSTRKLVQSVCSDVAQLPTLLKNVKYVDQKALARYAPFDIYVECFSQKFDKPDHQSYLMLKWLNHLTDDTKLKVLQIWCQKRRGTPLAKNLEDVSRSFLFLLDDETIEEVVTKKIDLEKSWDSRLHWQSMLPDDEESFAKQMECLKGESSPCDRADIYAEILDSVITLKRPQYLARRLKFLVKRTRNDYDAQKDLMRDLSNAMRTEYKFTISEDIWPLLEEMIDLQLLLNSEKLPRDYSNILLVGLEKVALDQRDLLAAIMEKLNKVLVLQTSKPWKLAPAKFGRKNLDSEPLWALKPLSKEKRQYFWNGALAYRETLEETNGVANGGVCPVHLQSFYLALAENKDETRSLIQAFPKTLAALKLIVSPRMKFENFSQYDSCSLFTIYEFLKPLIASGEPVHEKLAEVIKQKEIAMKTTEVLRTFRKSKLVTEEVREIYKEQRTNRAFLELCGRGLIHAEPGQVSKWLAMLKEDIEQNLRDKPTACSFDLLAMISDPQELKAEVSSSYPAEATFDLSGGDAESVNLLKRLGLVKSLRYFNDSELAFEMIMHFMKGDYLKRALGAFHRHLSRLPTARVVSQLRERIIKKDSPVSARKVLLQGFFRNTFMFDESQVLDVVRELSTEEEHDSIKRETLLATYGIVMREGEEKGWPLLKACLDSIGVEDRTCCTTILFPLSSIDKSIPTNLEYLMKKILEFSEMERYREHTEAVLTRIAGNVKMLSLEFSFAALEKCKSKNWSSCKSSSLPVNIVFHCVPDDAEALKTHLETFGSTKVLHLLNLTVLTREVVEKCLKSEIENAAAVLDFLSDVFVNRSSEGFRQLRLLELTKKILPLLPRSRNEEDLRPKLREVICTGIRATAGLLEEFGKELYMFFVDDLRRVLKVLLPWLFLEHKGMQHLLEVHHKGLSPIESMIFLTILGSLSPIDESGFVKSKEIFLQAEDERVRMAFTDFLIEKALGYRSADWLK